MKLSSVLAGSPCGHTMRAAYVSLCLSRYLEKFPVSGDQREDAGGGGAIREESQRRQQKWTVHLKFS